MVDVRELETTFIVTTPERAARSIGVTGTVRRHLDSRYGDFRDDTLVSVFGFEEAWPTREVHPAGDEIVCLLDSDVDVTLALPGGDETRRLTQSGRFLVIPRSVWHTASPCCRTRMLFVTPGERTENRERPVRARG